METQSLQLEELGCLFTKPFLFSGLVKKDPSKMSTNENWWTHILISACYKKYLCQRGFDPCTPHMITERSNISAIRPVYY